MKNTLLMGLCALGLASVLVLTGCEGDGDDGGGGGGGLAGTWGIHLVQSAGSSSGPGSAEWDTTLVISGSEGSLTGYLAGYDNTPLSQGAARQAYGSDTDYQLYGVISGNIEVLIWNLSASGSTISGTMRWGAGAYGAWRTWTFSGSRQ